LDYFCLVAGDKLSVCNSRDRGNRCGEDLASGRGLENQRVTGDKTVQRTVLYLGEINDSPTVGMAQNEKTPILQVFQEGISETDLPADSNQLILFDL
jgi:hypothetical protein